MSEALHIRPGVLEDAPEISALALSLAPFFTLDPGGRGAEEFLRTLQPEAVAQRLTAAPFTTWVAVANGGGAAGTMAGVVVVRDGGHLFHLFVAEPFQGRGCARRLWLHALSHLGPCTRVTVNATPFAQGFYERMGFVATGPQRQGAGIAFVPMVREGETA